MFRGSIVALVTPFNARGEVNFEVLGELVAWHCELGTDAIVLCGTTGEAPTLSHEETIQIFKEGVLAAKGRVPIIAGTGTYDTITSLQLTREAKEAGADAALVVLPYYSRPTPEGCFQHFQELSKVGFPLIVYHHPGRIGFKLAVQDLARISQIPHVVAIKDATGDLDYALELMQQTQTPILSGDDTLVLPQMASGAVGVISIVANLIPREWKALTTLLLSNQLSEGREFFNRFYPLVKSMVLETNPQCVKYALGAMDKCLPGLRLPLVEPKDAVKQQIVEEMIKAGLLLKSIAPMKRQKFGA
jgi:4-hydroxy-tetrahydrodipicolinate synthase